VTVRVYVPAITNEALDETVGLIWVEENPFGPVHEYEYCVPDGPPVRVSAEPAQTGPLLDAVATGNVFTTTVVLDIPWHPPMVFVTVRVYVPAIEVVAEVLEGFCAVDVYPFGPTQE
jgi:hypothetical protein